MKDTADYGFKPDDAIWCLHCERVFVWQDRRYDQDGLIECGYKDCDASPFDFSHWDGVFEVGQVYPMYSEVAMNAICPAGDVTIESD